MESPGVDVLLFCVLQEEYEQVLRVEEGLREPGWVQGIDSRGKGFVEGSFETPIGRQLRIRAICLASAASRAVDAIVSTLLEIPEARCLAVSGICSGSRAVSLGDVIFAAQFDFRADVHSLHYPAYVVRPEWVQRMQAFKYPAVAPWLGELSSLPTDGNARLAPQTHAALLAMRDSASERSLPLPKGVAYGVDIAPFEFATFSDSLGMPLVVAKGVADHVDPGTDTRYRTVAARAAAECLIALLRDSADLISQAKAEAAPLNPPATQAAPDTLTVEDPPADPAQEIPAATIAAFSVVSEDSGHPAHIGARLAFGPAAQDAWDSPKLEKPPANPAQEIPSTPPAARSLKLDGVLLPVWTARAIATILFAGAVGLPWLATWQGALRAEEPARKALPKEIQLRPELVELPGGRFLMGSPAGEAGSMTDEKQHPAEVAPFAICRTEVTLGQMEAVMGKRPDGYDCTIGGCEGQYPVRQVTWWDAIKYLNKVTERENTLLGASEQRTKCYNEATWEWDRSCTGYRLPTEAEWEYAARAGTETAYSFGNDSKDMCLYGNGARGLLDCDDRFENLSWVRRFKPNAWGLYDMHGNVWEWVFDLYGEYPASSPLDYAGPATAEGDKRVMRGGAYNVQVSRLRSSLRDFSPPSSAFRNLGFRCARSLR